MFFFNPKEQPPQKLHVFHQTSNPHPIFSFAPKVGVADHDAKCT